MILTAFSNLFSSVIYDIDIPLKQTKETTIFPSYVNIKLQATHGIELNYLQHVYVKYHTTTQKNPPHSELKYKNGGSVKSQVKIYRGNICFNRWNSPN